MIDLAFGRRWWRNFTADKDAANRFRADREFLEMRQRKWKLLTDPSPLTKQEQAKFINAHSPLRKPMARTPRT